MQSRYCQFENAMFIPMTGNRFTISMNGVVNNVSGEKVEVTRTDLNEPVVELYDGLCNYKIKISVLLAIITKRIRIPYSLWKELDVLYVDKNPENFNPGNTVWKFPKGGLRVNQSSDFCYIPGFSRYSVNKEGDVFTHITNRPLSRYTDQMGYWMYGLTPDVGNRTIMGMHRAIALAHVPYHENVDSLDVNHLDGIKSNNKLDNLEWASRKRNCDHAYSTGLRTDNIEVSVRNSFNGEIKSYYSLEECARNVNMDGETIRLRIRSSGQKVYPPGLQFKASSDNTDWKEVTDPLAEMRKAGFPIPIMATHCNTNQTFIFKTATELAEFLGISTSGVSWHLKTMKSFAIIRDYRIEFHISINNS